jgi:hypothetical protein
MNAKDFLLAVITVTTSLASFAQSNLLNAKIPEEIGLKLQHNLFQIMTNH